MVLSWRRTHGADIWKIITNPRVDQMFYNFFPAPKRETSKDKMTLFMSLQTTVIGLILVLKGGLNVIPQVRFGAELYIEMTRKPPIITVHPWKKCDFLWSIQQSLGQAFYGFDTLRACDTKCTLLHKQMLKMLNTWEPLGGISNYQFMARRLMARHYIIVSMRLMGWTTCPF